MSKKNSHQTTLPALQVPAVQVPPQFARQQAAFLLGVHDAIYKSRIERTFAHFPTETAYCAGVVAGIQARRTPRR